VQNKLGELGKATQEIKELGQSVSKLEEMLKAPKLRGGLGELLLEDLLKQVLPVHAYDIQYTFRNGQTVDAIINTAGGKVPVDSKFPLENFKRIIETQEEAEKKNAKRKFASDVKKHVDAIASKYILPDEGTFDFALMYVPAENVYYETIIKEESAGEGISEYALKNKVIPVSPNSFYAYIQAIVLGLKGMRIEKSASEIINHLARLKGDYERFKKDFDVLGGHIANIKNKYDEANKRCENLGDKLLSAGEGIPQAAISQETIQRT